MNRARLAVLVCVLAAGCAGQNEAPLQAGGPGASTAAVPTPETSVPQPGLAEVGQSAPASDPTSDSSPATPNTASPRAAAKSPPAPKAPASRAGIPARAITQPEPHAKSAIPESPHAKAQVKPAAGRPVVPEPDRSAPPVSAERRAEPTLDVTDLKTRLRETSAIGTFTKLALKNQMDDLLEQFRTLHQNGQGPRVAALRQPFDALVGKVLSLLQPGDPALARRIENSREGIWAILSDPEKFKSVT